MTTKLFSVTMSLVEAARSEILDFHVFLSQWKTGEMPRDLGAVEARLRVFDPEFRYIAPEGVLRGVGTLRTWFAGGHGTDPSLNIEIRNFRVRRDNPGCVLAVYEEHQHSTLAPSARISTACFVPGLGENAGGAAWFHLHEAWLPTGQPTSED